MRFISQILHWLARFALVTLIFSFAAGSPEANPLPAIPDLPLDEEAPLESMPEWAEAALNVTGQTALVTGLTAFLVAFSLSRRERGFVNFYFVALLVQAVILAGEIALSEPIKWFEFQVSVAVLASLLGLAAGGEFQFGPRGVLRLASALLLIGGGIGLYGYSLWGRAVDSKPRATMTELPSIEDRDELVSAIQTQMHENSYGEEQVQLDFSHEQIDTLINWAVAVRTLDLPFSTSIEDERIHSIASVEIPNVPDSYFNIESTATGSVDNGALSIEVEECTVGELQMPQSWLEIASELATRQINRLPEIREFLKPVESLTLDDQQVVLIGDREVFKKRLRRLAHEESELKEDELKIVRIYVVHVFEKTRVLRVRPGEERLLGAFREAFLLARKRSRTKNPVTENRAALFALAYLVGDVQIEPLIGEVKDLVGHDEVRQKIGEVTLYGRADWAKHYVLSGALTGLSGAFVSGLVGLWKERLDAHSGGSGYSFADLLADEAGTRMAEMALRDERTARVMQKRLSEIETTRQLMPKPDDLPEGIKAEDFDRIYGSGTGPAYERIRKLMKRQLDELDLLKPIPR